MSVLIPKLQQEFYAQRSDLEPRLDGDAYVVDPYAEDEPLPPIVAPRPSVGSSNSPAGASRAAMGMPPPRPPKRAELRIKSLTLSDVEIDRKHIILADELGSGEFGIVKRGALQ